MYILFFAILAGVIAGIFTGLIPGVHINLLSVILLSLSTRLSSWLSFTEMSAIIIAMSVTHTFLDALPSIYLGAPDESQILSALPGHRFLIQGKGHYAVLLTLVGSYFTLILSVLLIWLFLEGMRLLSELIHDIIGYLLIGIIVYLILLQKRPKKMLRAFFIFVVSGVSGLLVLNIKMEQPLFHLLSGLFGVSLLISSLLQNTAVPVQDSAVASLDPDAISAPVLGATIAGFFSAFLPGFGSSQAAIIASQFMKDIGDSGFLVLTGGLNTASMVISLGSFYVLEKARNGSIIVVRELLESLSFSDLLVFLLVAIIAGSLALLVALKISCVFSLIISKVNYRLIVILVISFLLFLSFHFDGLLGLFIMFHATMLGLLAETMGVGKNMLMGCLLLQVILYFIL